jgi:prophage regulatory protein
VDRTLAHGRSTTYNRIAEGLLPRPVKLGPRSIGWPDYEIEAINRARLAGRSDAEIRELVKRLERARAQADSPKVRQ